MLGPGTIQSVFRRAAVAQVSRSQVDVFDNLYLVFLVLGTIVGVVVIAYTIYNAYKYRVTEGDAEGRYDIEEDYSDEDEKGIARPRLGEIPTGTGKGGGKKLFVSFGISAIIVLSLLVYSFTLLVYVEGVAGEPFDLGNDSQNVEDREDALYVEVVGFQFDWEYTYPNGHSTNTLRVPHESHDEYNIVVLTVTSSDVFHNWGVPEFRAKADAIPGQTTTTWFQPDKTGEYEAICYELCGAGHSNMRGDVIVMEPDEFDEWYESTDEEEEN